MKKKTVDRRMIYWIITLNYISWTLSLTNKNNDTVCIKTKRTVDTGYEDITFEEKSHICSSMHIHHDGWYLMTDSPVHL